MIIDSVPSLIREAYTCICELGLHSGRWGFRLMLRLEDLSLMSEKCPRPRKARHIASFRFRRGDVLVCHLICLFLSGGWCFERSFLYTYTVCT